MSSAELAGLEPEFQPSLLAELDDPVGAALCGPHAQLAIRRGNVLRYPAEVAAFATLPAEPKPVDWEDAAELAREHGPLALVRPTKFIPPGWEVLRDLEVTQMVAASVVGEEDAELVRLGPADVPEMLELVRRTAPGPFGPRTIELGAYFGVRDQGELVAMAGERLSPPGCTELSAVCTAQSHRGRGLAARVMRGVANEIEQGGRRPFLHVLPTNAGAISVYERLGFVARRRLTICAMEPASTSRS